MASSYELYRKCTLGLALTDTLDELLQVGLVDPQLVQKILVQFDKSISDALTTKVKTKATIKASLATYRLCDGVWKFDLINPVVRYDNESVSSNRLEIVACDGKRIGDQV